MKQVIFLALISLSMNVWSQGPAKVELAMSHYKLDSTVIDTSLSSNEAGIVLNAQDQNGSRMNVSVYLDSEALRLAKKAGGNNIFAVEAGNHSLNIFGSNGANIITDSINFEAAKKYHISCRLYTEREIPMIVRPAKPIIYLYPETDLEVQIKLDFKGEFGFTYPHYDQGWIVKASPDGKISHAHKTYDYLFWDGEMTIDQKDVDLKQGAIVPKNQTITFLEETLNELGLNANEKNDFIVYWGPLLMKNERNYIQFLVAEDYDLIAGVEVQPQPDNVLRVFMLYQNADLLPGISPVKQTFHPIQRSGFTFVEWGGSEMNVSMDNL